MKRMFAALVTLTMMLLPLITLAQTAQPVKIGYIDLQKVMFESEKGRQAKKALTDEAEKLKRDLNQRQDEIQKLKDSIERQSATITPEARADREKQYQTKLKDYQRLASDFEQDLRQKDLDASGKILQELQEVVKRLADNEKYTLILERSAAGILYGSPSVDITDRVIALYNETSRKSPPAKK